MQCTAGDLDGALTGHDRQGGNLDLLAQRSQLLHGGRTTGVQRGHHHLFAVELRQTQGQFGRGGGLTRALQTGHQDDRRRGGVNVQRNRLFAAQHINETVIDDLDDLIGRLDRADDFLAGRLFLGAADEILDDRQSDVGFEQGHANFAQSLFDILFGQRTATGNPVEYASQPLVQSIKHSKPQIRGGHDNRLHTTTASVDVTRRQRVLAYLVLYLLGYRLSLS